MADTNADEAKEILRVYVRPDGSLQVDVLVTWQHDPEGTKREALARAVAETVSRIFGGPDA
jgi:hypothetical protein